MSSARQRLFAPVQVVISLLLFAEASVFLGISAWPAVSLWLWLAERLPFQGSLRVLALCAAAAGGYFIFGLSQFIVLPLARFATFSFGTPVGRYPYFSLRAYRWASYNALTLTLRFSFVNWIRVTPLLPLFHRLMGARIGRNVQINTAVVADQNLLSIGDDTVIGGDVTLVCHSAEAGALVAQPVRIGKRVTVGLMAVILPGCEIGDGASIAAGSVLKKGTVVGPGELWGGVPARKIGMVGDKTDAEPDGVATSRGEGT